MNRLFTLPESAKLDPQAAAQSTEVVGVLDHITFHNPENGYTVGRLKTDSPAEEFTVIGTFTNPVVGQYLRCEGTWIRHPQWGRQLQVRNYEAIVPVTAAGIERYLGSGMVPGIGPVMAKRIVAKFGDESLEVIENEPAKLLTVKGIGEKLLGRIAKAWIEQRAIRNIMVFLQSHGVTPTLAVKIYKAYQERSIEIVEQNPYQLATDIWGVGFKSADKIAQDLGFALDDPRRLIAGLVYTLNSAVESGGNVYLEYEELIDSAAQILGTREVRGALDDLAASGKLIRETCAIELPIDDDLTKSASSARQAASGEAYYIPSLYHAEVGVANNIRRRCSMLSDSPVRLEAGDDWVARCMARHGLSLSIQQQAAVELAIQSPVMVLTGGPGTGKTTTTRAIVHAFTDLHQRVLLASPTGRAAKRLTEVTGFDASTVHRLLAYDPQAGGFKHGTDSPIACDVLIVDESSMLDIVLANAVLRAVRFDARILFIGDVDQLPSVGPGKFLLDLIRSNIVPVASLTEVFRQAAASRIVTNAHCVNQGRMPELPSPKTDTGDFVFVSAAEAEELTEKLVAIVARSLPRRGFAVSDIQALVPMQRGLTGAISLNKRLQETLNPPSPEKAEVTHLGRTFRVGDRVMQGRNNYDRGVFNGDIGAVIGISHEESTVLVRMGENEVTYDFSECDEMSLAYALTIHKSQGSEFPVVVIAIHSQHYMLLQRKLLYTAITRARHFAVIVGTSKAISICVRNDKNNDRRTRLYERLTGRM